ncbi:MAG: pyridoxamine 5'-phosphate oxidase [Balneolaceae bacterium]|nr:pyridoxamine 5'-phosphate oxidase [Balneolaceae bacterium]
MKDIPPDKEKLAAIRREYAGEPLDDRSVFEDPVEQFQTWFEQALEAEPMDPNAMTLSTATPDGRPSSRVVLLKGFDPEGFRFYTNYRSRKGRELEKNPRAALCIYWPAMSRQVRIEGEVEKLGRAESREYFRQRPRPSRIAAWASEQSRRVESREELEMRFRDYEKQFEGGEVPLPEFWGGYLLRPDVIEFWQGREERMHDRLVYRREGESWDIRRLAP